MIAALLGAALAGAPPRAVTLSGSIGFTGGPQTVGGLAEGRALFHTPKISADLSGGEGYYGLDGREVGAIFIGARRYLPANLYVRGGFYHQHETLWEDFVANPSASFLGTDEAINHRSGLQVGLGTAWDWSGLMGQSEGLYGRLVTGFDASFAWMPSGVGPQWYAGVAFTNGLHVGKPRPAE